MSKKIIGWSRGYARRSGETSSSPRFNSEAEAIAEAIDITHSPGVVHVWVRPVYAGWELGRTTWEWTKE